MKKLSVLAAAAFALTAAAENPIVFPERPRFQVMSSVVSAKGETNIICTWSHEDKLTIFDEELNTKSEITIPDREKFVYPTWRQTRDYSYEAELKSTTSTGKVLSIGGNELNISLDQAANYLLQENKSAELQWFNGETVIALSYFMEDEFDERYIELFYKLVNGRWMEYKNEYSEPVKVYGEWEERENHFKTFHVKNLSSLYVKADGVGEEHEVTQAFFNNDSKFEYMVPKYELKEFTYEDDKERAGGQVPVLVAIDVMSDDGSKVMTLTIPDEYAVANHIIDGIYNDCEAIVAGKKKYVVMSGPLITLVYEIDGTSGVKAPAMVMEGAMKVHPTLPRRGETVTVDLGATAQPGCRIAVTAVNGRNALNLRAEKGETSVNIPTTSLAAGMYIVTVTNGTSSTEAAKIIIR